MHERVDATTTADGPTTELEQLRAENAALRALVEQLQQRIAERATASAAGNCSRQRCTRAARASASNAARRYASASRIAAIFS